MTSCLFRKRIGGCRDQDDRGNGIRERRQQFRLGEPKYERGRAGVDVGYRTFERRSTQDVHGSREGEIRRHCDGETHSYYRIFSEKRDIGRASVHAP